MPTLWIEQLVNVAIPVAGLLVTVVPDPHPNVAPATLIVMDAATGWRTPALYTPTATVKFSSGATFAGGSTTNCRLLITRADAVPGSEPKSPTRRAADAPRAMSRRRPEDRLSVTCHVLPPPRVTRVADVVMRRRRALS